MSKCLSLVLIHHVKLNHFALCSSAWSLETGHLTYNLLLRAARARCVSAFVGLCVLPLPARCWLLIQKMVRHNSLAERDSFICILGVNQSLLNGLGNLSPELFLSFEIFGHWCLILNYSIIIQILTHQFVGHPRAN